MFESLGEILRYRFLNLLSLQNLVADADHEVKQPNQGGGGGGGGGYCGHRRCCGGYYGGSCRRWCCSYPGRLNCMQMFNHIYIYIYVIN